MDHVQYSGVSRHGTQRTGPARALRYSRGGKLTTLLWKQSKSVHHGLGMYMRPMQEAVDPTASQGEGHAKYLHTTRFVSRLHPLLSETVGHAMGCLTSNLKTKEFRVVYSDRPESNSPDRDSLVALHCKYAKAHVIGLLVWRSGDRSISGLREFDNTPSSEMYSREITDVLEGGHVDHLGEAVRWQGKHICKQRTRRSHSVRPGAWRERTSGTQIIARGAQ